MVTTDMRIERQMAVALGDEGLVLVLFGLIRLPARDIGVARPVGRAGPRRRGGRRQIHLGRDDQLGVVAIFDVRLVLVAAEAEHRADADPQRRRAVVAGRRRRRRQAQPDEARGARRSGAAPDLPKRHRRHRRKPLLAVAATASRARKRPLRISGWPDNPANPRRGTRPSLVSPARPNRSPTTKRRKMGLPEVPDRVRQTGGPIHAPAARPEPGAAGRLAPKRPSTISSATPRLIAASARLKTKKWRPNACRSRKSTTAP